MKREKRKLARCQYRKRFKSLVNINYSTKFFLVEHKKQLFNLHEYFRMKGRAGRFGTQWEHGYVTTFRRTDLPTLKYLLGEKPEPITQAGLHPTAEQIELYAYHLPNSSLSSLMVIIFHFFPNV